jgi:hypothetical protein
MPWSHGDTAPPFLTSASYPDCFTPWERVLSIQWVEWVGPRAGCYGEQKNLFSTRNQTLTIQATAPCNTNWAIPTLKLHSHVNKINLHVNTSFQVAQYNNAEHQFDAHITIGTGCTAASSCRPVNTLHYTLVSYPKTKFPKISVLYYLNHVWIRQCSL